MTEVAQPTTVQIAWQSRGVGMDATRPCGWTQHNPVCANCSGFVRSREDGELLESIFGIGAWLDYRPSEPKWLQLKVYACSDHAVALQELDTMSRVNKGALTPKDIAEIRMSFFPRNRSARND